MPRRPAAIRWCAWCGETLRSRKTRFCGPKCRNDFTEDYWRREAAQPASVPACPSAGGAALSEERL